MAASMKTRRWMLGQGAALAGAAALTACGGSAAPGGTTSTGAAVSPAAGGTPGAATQVTIKGKLVVLEKKDFNEKQNQFLFDDVTAFADSKKWPLDISYTEGFTGGTNFYQKISGAVSAGDSPDMMIGDYSAFQLWDLKSVQPVDDVVAAIVKDYGDPIPGLKYADNFQGKWWAVPYFARVDGYWARKSWFDPISFDINAQHSMQDWLDAALKVSDASKQRWGYGNSVNRSGDGETNVRDVVFGAGGRYTDQSGTKVAFNSPETIAGYEWLKDVYTNQKWAPALPPGVNAWTDISNNQALLAGTIGFTRNGGTLFASANTDAPEIAKDMFFVPVPTSPVGKKEAISGPAGASLYLFAGAKNPDAAKQVMQHLLSKEILKKIWAFTPGYPTPGYKWGWDEPEVVNTPNNVSKQFQKMVYGTTFFTWMPGPEPKLWIDAIGDAVVLTDTMAAILGGQAVKDAVADGHKKIEAIRDKFEGK
jgi:multiple sugar transport system substrate-binding protein